LLCRFISKINIIANDIIYELYDSNNEYYLIKWIIDGNKFKMKCRKSEVDKMFEYGKYEMVM
jgi:hypothetical protein